MIAEGGLDQSAVRFSAASRCPRRCRPADRRWLCAAAPRPRSCPPRRKARRSLSLRPTCWRTLAIVRSTKFPIVQLPGAFADFVQEILENLLAPRRVRHLRMKLHAIKRPRRVPGRRERTRRRRRQRHEIRCQLMHLIAMAHPDRRLLRQARGRADRPSPRAASPAQTPAPWPASPARRESGNPTASRNKSPEIGTPRSKIFGSHLGAFALIHAARPAGEDDPLWD